METTSQTSENEFQNNQLVLTNEAIVYLKTIASWTTFFSILGFVFVGLMVVMGFGMTLFMSSVFATAGKPFMAYIGLVYAVFAVIYLMPVIYLYRFSTVVKRAIQNCDSNDIMLAFKNLKSHYKFMGILTIVILALYLVVGIGFALVKFMV